MKGIDISVWQKEVDYTKLKSQGIDFVIIRCGFGKNESQKDSMFDKHYEGCKKAGLKIGTYLYSYGINENSGIEEAYNCLRFINHKTFDLPIFYDVENEDTTGRNDKYQITKMCENFCEIIKKEGYQAGVYANLYWFNSKMYVDELIKKNYKIWLAQWNKTMDAKFKVDYWQYGKGEISGIKGEVDLNESFENENIEYYQVGNVYETLFPLNVRAGAGTEYRIKLYDELTYDGKKHAYNQYYGVLKPNTKVTCLATIKTNDQTWLKIPSGFICAKNGEKIYVK